MAAAGRTWTQNAGLLAGLAGFVACCLTAPPPGMTPGAWVVAGAMVLMICWFWWAHAPPTPHAPSKHIGFALVLAGAIGNLADRIARGYVVDFIYLHRWPVFNVADICIAAGAVLLLLPAVRARAAPS